MAKSRKHFRLTATIYNKKGHVIAVGENSYHKTHPLQVKLAHKNGRPGAIFLHAEIQALVRLKDWSKAHKIYIERYGDDGTPLPAAPCNICRQAIEQAGIVEVVHT